MKAPLKSPAHLRLVHANTKRVQPPKHLAPATKAWFRSVLEMFELEEHHIRLLTLACQAWDRAEQARELLAEEGLTTRDRYGTAKAHPAVAIERDSRLAFARLLRELDLDADQAPEVSRPPAIRSNRRGRG